MTDKEKVEVEVEGKKIVVNKPSSRVSQQATKKYAIEFTKALEEGLMTRAKMKDFLLKHGVWTEAKEKEEKDIADKINAIELELYRGSGKKKMSLKEGRDKALEIKELRGKYVDLISERQSYEANTAESIADNVRFDYLVSECTVNKDDGKKVYSSYEDYQAKSNEATAYEAASALAKMMYSLEDDFAKKLPENQFLSMFNLVDDKLRLVNDKNQLVDKDYRRISEEGYYLDEDGNRVDINGVALTEDGLFNVDVSYTDDDGNVVKPKGSSEEEVGPPIEETVEAERAKEAVAVEVTEETIESIG